MNKPDPSTADRHIPDSLSPMLAWAARHIENLRERVKEELPDLETVEADAADEGFPCDTVYRGLAPSMPATIQLRRTRRRWVVTLGQRRWWATAYDHDRVIFLLSHAERIGRVAARDSKGGR